MERQPGRKEARLYSSKETPERIGRILIRNVPHENFRGSFENISFPITRTSDFLEEENAYLTCRGIHFHNNEGKSVLAAIGEIADPKQMTEKGDTFIFVVLEDQVPTLPKDRIKTLLSRVAFDYDRVIEEYLEIEKEKVLGLIVGRGKFKEDGRWGFISVDKGPENYMIAQPKKSWLQKIAYPGEITEGHIGRVAQEIGKEIGVEVTFTDFF